MILNCLFDNNILYYKLDDFQTYIRYLKYLGFVKDILNSFNRLYSNYNNINPYCYLGQIPLSNIDYARSEEFEKCKKKRKF